VVFYVFFLTAVVAILRVNSPTHCDEQNVENAVAPSNPAVFLSTRGKFKELELVIRIALHFIR